MLFRFNILYTIYISKRLSRLNTVYIRNIRNINKLGNSQLGPYVRITWGAFKYPYTHAAPNQLNQNLWGWGPSISIFKILIL